MQQTHRQPAEHGNGVVAWLLMLMALAAFAPCVLLPEWRAYQAVRVEEQAQQHRLDALKRVVDRERRLLEAMQSDPAVIARLAQRDLGFRYPGHRPVLVSVPASSGPTEQPFVPEPVLPPPIVARVASYLPDYDYDAVFCDDRPRLVIMAMSVALIGVALWLPVGARRSRGRASARTGRRFTPPPAQF